MASLRPTKNPKDPFCGGTHIHPRVVLTAAHVSLPLLSSPMGCKIRRFLQLSIGNYILQTLKLCNGPFPITARTLDAVCYPHRHGRAHSREDDPPGQ